MLVLYDDKKVLHAPLPNYKATLPTYRSLANTTCGDKLFLKYCLESNPTQSSIVKASDFFATICEYILAGVVITYYRSNL